MYCPTHLAKAPHHSSMTPPLLTAMAFTFSPIRLLRSCTFHGRIYQASRASPSCWRSLDQPGPFAVTTVFTLVLPYSRWGPVALPAVLHSYGPGGHPPAFGCRCRHLPFSEVFLPGTGRASPVTRTTLPCMLPSVPRWECGRYQSEFRHHCCLRPRTGGSAPKVVRFRGLLDVRYLRPTRSLPRPSLGLSEGTVPGFRL